MFLKVKSALQHINGLQNDDNWLKQNIGKTNIQI